jgi:GAF domain-containing protein
MAEITPIDPIEAFGQLARINFGETDLDEVLKQIAELARRSVPGAYEVSVTLVRDRGANTAAFTGRLALALDESQYEDGTGPCLDAAADGVTLSLPDMRTESRWPRLAGHAREAGCLSSLSIGLPVREKVAGALNIYAADPGAFDDDAIKLAETFAGYAAVALANAHLYETTTALAQQMQAAMESRAVIEQAKGIVIRDRHCTPEEAFQILTKLSQDTNRKLRDIATALVARATEPPRS